MSSLVPAATRAPIELEVGGQRLRLNANADAKDLVVLAGLVNERFDAIQRETKSAIPSKVLALVALSLADELDAARRAVEHAREDARRAVAAAEARAFEVEQMARRAVAEAIAEIDRTLGIDDELSGRHVADDDDDASASETA